jgi:translation initiation factor IF-3
LLSLERVRTIARPRYSRPQESFHRGPSINDRIRASKVFLIDHNNEKVGVVDTIEALRRSHEAGLDLVEVSPDSTPPVCRILDFGKYKYELAKKEKANRAKTKTAELKEVRLGRSMKIDPHDVEIRINQARRFLIEGHKVQIVQNFRGREMMHRDRGNQRMKEIIEKLVDLGKVELAPRMMGRRMMVILSPDKPKIDAYLRKHGPLKPQKDPPPPVDDHDDDDHDESTDQATRETQSVATEAKEPARKSSRATAKAVPVPGST